MKKILVLGSLNMDFVIRVKNIPQIGETVIGKDVKLVPGGKGANQSYAVGKLGGNVMMLGAVGTDLYGKELLNNLSNVNVDVSAIQQLNNIPTGQAFVSVYDSGDNSIVVIPGANGCVDKEMIDANIKYIDECDYIIMQLEIPIETVQYVKNLAISKGKKVIIDPAPAIPNLNDDFWKNVSLIKPNETEIGILTGKKVSTVEDAIDSAKLLIKKGVETVIVTLGGDGCLFVDNEHEKYYPAKKVECIDTTAAGDSFIAALVVALSENQNYEKAIEFAQKVSSLVVTRKGAQTSIPCRAEL